MSLVEAAGPIKRAKIDLSADGDLVAAVTGKCIRVLAMAITVDTADGLIAFRSGATTAISGPMKFADNGQLILPWNPGGWMQTTVSEKLDADVTTSGQVSGVVTYQEVSAG